MTEEFGSSEPLSSNVIKFRVSINFPAKWKVQSIAEYKQAQKRKHEQSSINIINDTCDLSINSKSPRQDQTTAAAKPLPDRSRSYLVSRMHFATI